MIRKVILTAVVAAVVAAGQQWPQFRGPNGSGVAAEDAAPPVEFGAKAPLWKTAVPAGHSSPVVWGSRLFLTSVEPSTGKLELLCLDARTGAIVWRRAAPKVELEKTHVVSNPATASPAVDEKRVYAYFSSYGLMAFTHAGESQWTLPLAMPVTHHGSGASPILAGGRVIINHDAMKDGYLVAVDCETGKEAWRTAYAKIPGRVESYSTPAVWRDQVVLHRAGIIEGYRIADGGRVWSYAAKTSGLASPVVSEGLVFVETWYNFGEDDLHPPLPDFATLLKRADKNGDGKLSESEFPQDIIVAGRPGLEQIPNSQNYVAFRPVDRNHDGFIDKEEWDAHRAKIEGSVESHGLLALQPEGTGAKVVWRENSSIPEVPSPLLYRGRIYLVRNGGVLTCLDAGTGKVLYRGRVGAPGAYFASPVAAAGRVYLASSEGVVTVLDAAASAGVSAVAHNALNEEIVATPAIAGNVIYVRGARTLYAFSGR